MKILEGSPVSPGFASGIAIVCDYAVERKETLLDRDILYDDVETECGRIDDALDRSQRELKLAEQTASGDPKLADAAALLSAHASMASEIAATVKKQIGCDLRSMSSRLLMRSSATGSADCKNSITNTFDNANRTSVTWARG